ncbi:FAD binding domain-containing protein [Geodermatophilus sp. SYSU D01105]
MKPAPFDYLAPTTVEETLAVLREHGDDAKVLAGGQSLVPMLNFRLARPAVLVDVNSVAGLDEVAVDGETLTLGATVRQRALETRLPDRLPPSSAWTLLPRAVAHVGHKQIRARGTVGGSLAHADPAAELPAAVTALGATFCLRSAEGEREVGPDEFFEGFFTTCLAPEELLVAVRFPAWPAGTGTSFLEVSRRRGDFAQVAVAAAVTVDDGRITRAGVALAGVAAGTVDAQDLVAGLVGQEPAPATFAGLAADYAATLDPPPDVHGPAEYRRALAAHLLERALTEATGTSTATAA